MKKTLEIQIKKYGFKQIQDYCFAEFTFYFENHAAEPDCSNVVEGIQDVLEKIGVIKNDKLINPLFVRKSFEDLYPRVEVKIYKLGGDEKWINQI